MDRWNYGHPHRAGSSFLLMRMSLILVSITFNHSIVSYMLTTHPTWRLTGRRRAGRRCIFVSHILLLIGDLRADILLLSCVDRRPAPSRRPSGLCLHGRVCGHSLLPAASGDPADSHSSGGCQEQQNQRQRQRQPAPGAKIESIKSHDGASQN